jgi:hypothetical protein
MVANVAIEVHIDVLDIDQRGEECDEGGDTGSAEHFAEETLLGK